MQSENLLDYGPKLNDSQAKSVQKQMLRPENIVITRRGQTAMSFRSAQVGPTKHGKKKYKRDAVVQTDIELMAVFACDMIKLELAKVIEKHANLHPE